MPVLPRAQNRGGGQRLQNTLDRKRIFESGRVLSTCYTRPKTKENGHPWWAYVYDEYFDDVICPEYRALHYSTTNQEGYREYKSRG